MKATCKGMEGVIYIPTPPVVYREGDAIQSKLTTEKYRKHQMLVAISNFRSLVREYFFN